VIQALAGVNLGARKACNNGLVRRALALLTDKAALISLRTQQIIAEATGNPEYHRSVGGLYLVEALTAKHGTGATRLFQKTDAMGGMVAAIEKGFPQREIQDPLYQASGKPSSVVEQTIVGVNKYQVEGEQTEIPTPVIDESVCAHQLERLEKTRVTLETRCRRVECASTS